MDREKVITTGLEVAAYVFNMERSATLLNERYLASGVAEADLEAFMQTRRSHISMRQGVIAVALIIAGSGVNYLASGTWLGTVGKVIMYVGIGVSVLMVWKRSDHEPISRPRLTDLFRKK